MLDIEVNLYQGNRYEKVTSLDRPSQTHRKSIDFRERYQGLNMGIGEPELDLSDKPECLNEKMELRCDEAKSPFFDSNKLVPIEITMYPEMVFYCKTLALG